MIVFRRSTLLLAINYIELQYPWIDIKVSQKFSFSSRAFVAPPTFLMIPYLWTRRTTLARADPSVKISLTLTWINYQIIGHHIMSVMELEYKHLSSNWLYLFYNLSSIASPITKFYDLLTERYVLDSQTQRKSNQWRFWISLLLSVCPTLICLQWSSVATWLVYYAR